MNFFENTHIIKIWKNRLWLATATVKKVKPDCSLKLRIAVIFFTNGLIFVHKLIKLRTHVTAFHTINCSLWKQTLPKKRILFTYRRCQKSTWERIYYMSPSEFWGLFLSKNTQEVVEITKHHMNQCKKY